MVWPATHFLLQNYCCFIPQFNCQLHPYYSINPRSCVCASLLSVFHAFFDVCCLLENICARELLLVNLKVKRLSLWLFHSVKHQLRPSLIFIWYLLLLSTYSITVWQVILGYLKLFRLSRHPFLFLGSQLMRID